MNIGFWLHRRAQTHGNDPALFLGRELVADYAGFHRRAAQVAAWLMAQGVQPGDRVAIFMKNCPDYLIVQYGIWYAGAAAVPINAKLHPREAAFILSDSGTGIVFSSPGLAEPVADLCPDTRVIDVTDTAYAQISALPHLGHLAPRAPDDLAWLFYTSGTTGQPKGVIITHRMLTTMSLC